MACKKGICAAFYCKAYAEKKKSTNRNKLWGVASLKMASKLWFFFMASFPWGNLNRFGS